MLLFRTWAHKHMKNIVLDLLLTLRTSPRPPPKLINNSGWRQARGRVPVPQTLNFPTCAVIEDALWLPPTRRPPHNPPP